MFSYYGSKSKIVRHYPEPKHATIIEPFCGSARYALLHWELDVMLYDLDPDVVLVWEWLINDATPNDILSMPTLKAGTPIPDMGHPAATKFLAYMSNQGSSIPKNVAGRMNFCKWNPYKVAELIPRVKHWTIQHSSYLDIPNYPSCTWYIDPPYQRQGRWYRHNKIDYSNLSEWCRSRLGQVIVCENDGADWLPFEQFVSVSGQSYVTKEVMWTNDLG